MQRVRGDHYLVDIAAVEELAQGRLAAWIDLEAGLAGLGSLPRPGLSC